MGRYNENRLAGQRYCAPPQPRLQAFVTIVLTIGMCPAAWADEISDIRAGEQLASKVGSYSFGEGRLAKAGRAAIVR
jgi:hypothetical protein